MKNLPENIRQTKGFHLDYIYRFTPSLLKTPFNNKSKTDQVKTFLNHKLNKFFFR